ncbi:MAG: substrate-binding domain-containing protein [Blastocatellia bacterium]
MHKKQITFAFLFIFIVMLSVSCNNAPESGKKEIVIAVIPKGVAHFFWQSVKAGAEAAGKEAGVTIDWKGPANETDYASQVNVVEDAIARRVSGIVLAPSHRESLIPPVERAKRENIPVVIFDSGIGTESYVSYVSTDNVKGGEIGAERMAAKLGGKGKIAVLGLKAGSVSTDERESGFQNLIKKNYPGIQIVDFQYGDSDRAKSLDKATDMMTAAPDLAAIFASNEPSTVGAAQAIKQQKKEGKVLLVGFDSSPNLVDDLRAGVIDSLIVQNPWRMGYDGVKAIVDKLNGKEPQRRVDTGVSLVTKENLDSPEVQKLLGPK